MSRLPAPARERASSAPSSRRTRLAFLALVSLSFAFPLGVRADDAPPADEERQDAIDRHVEKGLAAYRRGNHEEALARMDRLAKIAPEHPLPTTLAARVHARVGRYEEALDLASKAAAAHPEDRGIEALRFDLLRRLGRLDAASTAAEAALAARPDDLVARTMRGLLFEERGRRKEALADYDAVIEAYNRADPPPEELTFVAQAAIRAHRLSPNPADDLLEGAAKLLARRLQNEPGDVDAKLVYADLYQSNRGSNSQAAAGKHYREILAENSEVAEARVGTARIAVIFYDQDKAVEECRRALATNPNLVSAMNLLAQIHVGDGDYDKADEMWKRASAVNPVDKEARAIRAARLFVSGDEAGYGALEKEVLAQDPTWGRFYTIVASLVGERQRRYDVAAALTEKGIALDPTDDQAHVLAGLNLMNLGREDEAKARFEEAIRRSKGYADVVRTNYLEVLEILATFKPARSEHFVLKQHASEAAVMEPYLLPLLEDARKALEAKYGWAPKEPVLVESFHRHDDFSVRSVGARNIPALGVCFGRVITLDGPLSRPLGSFSWARTAWHEYAHVVTLGISEGQVPRWLTEGLSVHEEKARKPEWGRELEEELYHRWRNGRLLKMADINGAFRTPDIMFAYFQGGLIADFLEQTRGFEVVPKMLARFAKDVTTEQVFREELGIELAKFDETFSEWVGGLVGGYKVTPRWDDKSRKAFEERTAKDPKDAEAWTRLGWAELQRGRSVDAGAALAKAMELTPDAPEVVLLRGMLAARNNRPDLAKAEFTRFLETGNDDLHARLALAQIAKGEGKDSAEVVRQLEAAKACFPRHIGKGNPYLELAKLYQGSGEVKKAIAEMEAYAKVASEDYGVRKSLASHYKREKDDAALLRVSQEMVEINPFGAKRGDDPDLDLHRDYAEALLRANRREEALREWKVQTLLVGLLPEDDRAAAGAVDAYLAYGRLLLEMGKSEEALEQALSALRIDPDSPAAKVLKGQAQSETDFR
jgi:tetratricopeptide (TPR) repeat protein